MKKMLATFKYESQLNITTATNYTNGELINEIVTLLRSGDIVMTNCKHCNYLEFDSPVQSYGPVIENHTIMDVRLEIHNPEHPEEAIDLSDNRDDLFHYVLDALEMGEPEVTYYYTSGVVPLQKSLIGIEIHPAY